MKLYLKTFLFCAAVYCFNFAVLSSFFLISDYYGVEAAVFSFLTIAGYAMLYTLPSSAVSGAVYCVLFKFTNPTHKDHFVSTPNLHKTTKNTLKTDCFF